MRIDARDEHGERIGRLEVDPAARPSRARTSDTTDREVFLEWEAALDDGGHLRRCLVCGCRDLYVSRMFPQVTGFVVVMAFAAAAVGIFGSGGIARNPVVLTALIVVLVLDIASLIFRKYRLVCYRCRSTFSEIDLARFHRAWDRSIAEKHRREAEQAPPPLPAPSPAIVPSQTEARGHAA